MTLQGSLHILIFVFPLCVFLFIMTFFIIEIFHMSLFSIMALFAFWLTFILILLNRLKSILRILKSIYPTFSLWLGILILEIVYGISIFHITLLIMTLFLRLLILFRSNYLNLSNFFLQDSLTMLGIQTQF